MTELDGSVYEYDEHNQIVRLTSDFRQWVYLYNAEGQRLWQLEIASVPRQDHWTIRDLDGKVLRVFEVEPWGEIIQ